MSMVAVGFVLFLFPTTPLVDAAPTSDLPVSPVVGNSIGGWLSILGNTNEVEASTGVIASGSSAFPTAGGISAVFCFIISAWLRFSCISVLGPVGRLLCSC
ncbi:hypothetical protein FVEG_15564 [Fusarium verticillioides 7600]|uniref:Secreted peptide n=1 Tax=Gibberella moniliformis (strain M3125 / FGSC 7600) TaxID=334819 RepID=W7LVY0_GIBM7|nr:hypothetical protein FVEG_15564 [Fusarium verticillioides 7600]EWG43383.1 hypothetical protein FVEG_15564 [Fusarium verticillioides 7600]